MTIADLYVIYQQYPSVQTDSRKLQQGDIFFALKGPSFNGNRFVEQAFEKGASYCVIDEKEAYLNEKTILVDDVLDSLQQLARHHRQQFHIPFLAVTGSNGKTTTKELIHAVLSSTFKTYTTEGNLNNHIGVPLTILKIRKDAEFAIIEMGANHLREIASYCEIALPTHGLITNCGKAHLEGFGSEEGVKKGKGELFDHLRAHGGTAFIMNDYDYLRKMSKGIEKVFSYGTKEANVVGRQLHADPFLEVECIKGLEGVVRTRLVGGYNLPNVLAAIATGVFFNVRSEKIISSIQEYEPSNSRSQMIRKGKWSIILDAYNANPSSMKLAIDNFANMEGSNKILVLGAMAELGNDSLSEHKAIVTEINKHQWKDVLLVGGDFNKIDHPFHKAANAEEAGKLLRAKELDTALLLLKGSRSTGMEKVLDYL